MWGILLPFPYVPLQCSRSLCLLLSLKSVAALALSNGVLHSAAAKEESRVDNTGIISINIIYF
jgi:hypothetical protein